MNASGRLPLSALVIARDEEEMIGDCLASLAFADERVVVDSGSADRTPKIARAHGAEVIEHPFTTHAEQKNWGLERVAHDWVLVVDADERVTPELAREIASILAGTPSAPGFWIRRRSTFLGRRIRGAGWQRDRVLRLFDRRRGRYAERAVHEEVVLDARAGTLNAAFDHHPCRDLGRWIDKTKRYAELGAREAFGRGERAGVAGLVLRPPARFLKQYVAQGGFRDGLEGFLLCAISAFGVFVKYAMLRELARRAP